jgi:hypothetical protein
MVDCVGWNTLFNLMLMAVHCKVICVTDCICYVVSCHKQLQDGRYWFTLLQLKARLCVCEIEICVVVKCVFSLYPYFTFILSHLTALLLKHSIYLVAWVLPMLVKLNIIVCLLIHALQVCRVVGVQGLIHIIVTRRRWVGSLTPWASRERSPQQTLNIYTGWVPEPDLGALQEKNSFFSLLGIKRLFLGQLPNSMATILTAVHRY